jgi:membrane protein DedA with SNARE-associated domain
MNLRLSSVILAVVIVDVVWYPFGRRLSRVILIKIPQDFDLGFVELLSSSFFKELSEYRIRD